MRFDPKYQIQMTQPLNAISFIFFLFLFKKVKMTFCINVTLILSKKGCKRSVLWGKCTQMLKMMCRMMIRFKNPCTAADGVPFFFNQECRHINQDTHIQPSQTTDECRLLKNTNNLKLKLTEYLFCNADIPCFVQV